MKLSILIVTYNQEQYINDCLDGLVIQQLPFDYEIIIADDNSNDGTKTIIDNRLRDSKLKYQILESSQNVGMYSNYERGFKACRGEYISLLEGDDYWTDPKRIVKHINFLDNHRECVLSFNRIIQYNENTGKFKIPKWNLRKDFEYITTSEMAHGNLIGNLSACVLRRSVLLKLKPEFYSLQFADWLLGMALGQFGLLAKLEDAMSVYRIHGNGQWSKLTLPEQKENILNAIAIYDDFFEKKYTEEFNEYKKGLTGNDVVLKKNWKTLLKEYLPPLFVLLLNLIIPYRLRCYIKSHLH